jgi:hypothetical protein
LLADALIAVRNRGKAQDGTARLATFASRLSGQPKLLAEALSATRHIHDPRCRDDVRSVLEEQLGRMKCQEVPDVSEASTPFGLESVPGAFISLPSGFSFHIEAVELRTIDELSETVPNILAELRPKLVELVQSHLADYPTLLAKAMRLARANDKELVRRAGLFPYREALWTYIADAALPTIPNEGFFTNVLMTVVAQSQGDSELLSEALAAARGIGNISLRIQALQAVAWQLTGRERQEVLSDVLTAAREISYEPLRARVLSGIAIQLTNDPELLRQALAASRDIADGRYRADVISALVEPLRNQSKLLGEALSSARSIGDKRAQTIVLTALAGYLEGKDRQALLSETDRKRHRAQMKLSLSEQARYANVSRRRKPTRLPRLAVYDQFASQLDIGSLLPRKKCLVSLRLLSPSIAALGGQAAIRETAQAIRDVSRWWP